MSIVKTVVNRPTTFLIIFILLMVLGTYAALNISVDILPEVESPVITLSTTYSGASPAEIENSITKIIESAVASIKNVNKVVSTAERGYSSTVVEFHFGTDLDDATADLRNNLGLVADQLPTESTTQILQYNTANIPILVLQLAGNRDLSEIYRLADENVRPYLERQEGVARVVAFGAADPILRIEVPQERLDAYSLSLQNIAAQLRANNSQVLGGQIADSNLDYLVESSGSFENIETVKNAVVAYRGSSRDGEQTIVRVRDIANTFVDYEQKGFTDVYVNGNPAIYVVIQKRSQSNTVQTADNVLTALAEIEQRLPADMSFETVWDSSKLIRNSLSSTAENGLWGVVLAVFILFVFLRSVRATLVISISIPISLVVTLMAMYFLDLSLNLMTLAGLALGVGMLVDNSIVILENIYRYRNRGVALVSSAMLGSKEMITPIVSSTLTTICVFIPLALFRNELGQMGEWFTALALTVVIALCTSLAVALFLVPVLASHYLRLQPSVLSQKRGFFPAVNRVMEGTFTKVEILYKRSIAALLRHRYISFLLLTTVLVLAIVFLPTPGFNAFPRFEDDRMLLDIDLPVGTQSEDTEEVLFALESYIQTNYGHAITNTAIEIGEGVRGPGTSAKKGNIGSFTIVLPNYQERPVSVSEFQQVLRKQLEYYPSVEFSFSSPGGGNLQEGSAIEIRLSGNDYNELETVGEKIIEVMENIKGIVDPRLNLPKPMPQINVVIARQRAYDLGLSIDVIGAELKAALNGVSTNTIEIDGKEYDIELGLPERNRDELPDLSRLFVMTSSGQKIPLSNLVHYERGFAPQKIQRENQSRFLKISADIDEGFNSSDVVPGLQQEIKANVPFTDSVTIEYSGSYQDYIKNMQTFSLFGLFAILLVYGIMASLFESFLDPFIILFTIPLTFVGVILVYVLTGDSLNSFTAVGFIMLFGIVVNNGIVLVDYINLLRNRGRDIFVACAEAGKDRLRPILMTTMTTVLGMTPIAFISGEGSELVQPIAKAVVGGLSVGSFLTLFFVPVLYAIFNIWSVRMRGFFQKRAEKKEKMILEVKHVE